MNNSIRTVLPFQNKLGKSVPYRNENTSTSVRQKKILVKHYIYKIIA